MPRTLKLSLAYDGTRYAGWQFQPEQLTVQGTLEAAIAQATGQSVRVVGSGRTDAGVHALGQVVSFETETALPCDVLQRAINAWLPADMVVLGVEEAAPRFHAIRNAITKRYRYLLHDGPLRDVFGRQYAWHVRTPLDAERMHAAAQHWLGRHDFSSFQTQGSVRTSTVRTVLEVGIQRGWRGERDLLAFEVEADGFLYNMVRTMIGTLVKIGDGTRPTQWAEEVLAACDRSAAGMTTPAHGLYLVHVQYGPPPEPGSPNRA